MGSVTKAGDVVAMLTAKISKPLTDSLLSDVSAMLSIQCVLIKKRDFSNISLSHLTGQVN